MAVNTLALADLDFGELLFVTEKNTGEIHQFGHAGDTFVGNHQLQIVGREPCPGGFEMRRGNAAWQHDEEIHGQILGGFQNVTDAIEPEHVGVFVWINHHRAGAMRSDRAHKLRRSEHGAFHVKMPVNQARREIRAFEINRFPGLVITEADDAAIFDGNVGLVISPLKTLTTRAFLKISSAGCSPRAMASFLFCNVCA